MFYIVILITYIFIGYFLLNCFPPNYDENHRKTTDFLIVISWPLLVSLTLGFI